MSTARTQRIALVILAATSLVLWLLFQTEGNVAPACLPPGPCVEGGASAHQGWSEIVAVNADSIEQAEQEGPLPLWRVRHADGGIVALADATVHADCMYWSNAVEIAGKEIRVTSVTKEATPEACAWHGGKRRWAEFRLHIPAGVYHAVWTRDGSVIDERDLAVPN